jgi:hypothetical protein
MPNIEYRIFIDESGEREYGEATSAYFVYLGCIIKFENIKDIEESISRIKCAYFKTDDAEFKSNWFRIPKERKKRYLLPFNLTETAFREMTGEIYRTIQDSPTTLIASVIDKKMMFEKYREKAFSPSGFAYELLMERYQYFLQEVQSIGDVVIDDISGKNPKGHPYKELIKSLHARLQRYGSTGQKVKIDRITGSPKFWPSEKSNIIQIADFCAYNTMRQFRDYGEEWKNSANQTFKAYGPFTEIISNFRSDKKGKIQGFGIVKFPEKNKSGWNIKK